MRSLWCGDATNAFYSSEKFDKYRILSTPEFEKSNKAKNSYYAIGVDVGRYGCTTEAAVFKVTPQLQGQAIKSLVNLFTYDAEHFEDQSIHLKRLYYAFQARVIAIDANGLGAGLVDFLTTTQIDPETGDILPPFGVLGGTSEDIAQQYKKVRGSNVEENALYLIKANAAINTEAYSNAQIQMSSGKVKFLINESQAKTKLMSTKVGQNMTSEKRNEYLRPFILTSILREQTLNLTEENEGTNIILKQSSKSIKKDKFSAFIYGLYYIKQEEERLANRKRKNIKDFFFFF